MMNTKILWTYDRILAGKVLLAVGYVILLTSYGEVLFESQIENDPALIGFLFAALSCIAFFLRGLLGALVLEIILFLPYWIRRLWKNDGGKEFAILVPTKKVARKHLQKDVVFTDRQEAIFSWIGLVSVIIGMSVAIYFI